MMRLLHITTPDAGLPVSLGALPGVTAEHRLVLDPAASLSGATAAVTGSLRVCRLAWIVTVGRAATPFVAALASDLSLAVAGALILAPEQWLPGRSLARSPLSFPACVLAGQGDQHSCRQLAQDWGAKLLTARQPGPIMSDPAVIDMIERRMIVSPT